MARRPLSLAVLLGLTGCDRRPDVTPHTPAPIDADPTLSGDLALPGADAAATVVLPRGATLPEVLAAKEVRRYRQRTGTLLPSPRWTRSLQAMWCWWPSRPTRSSPIWTRPSP